MKNFSIRMTLRLVALSLVITLGCDDFLDTRPYGTTTFQDVSGSLKGADLLLIAAYSNLDGVSDQGWTAGASNWIYGSLRGGDAYKGSVQGDQFQITPMELHTTLNPTNVYIAGKWVTYYSGIARANDAIRAFKNLEYIDKDLREIRIAEARFLRGLYHLELYKNFGHVPYLDDSTADVRIPKTENILNKIKNDFLAASDELPNTQQDAGRITKEVALAYLGITYMWTPVDYTKALSYFNQVIQSGKYELNARYQDNFDADFRNKDREAILQFQTSVDDGTAGANGNYGDVLNHPAGINCCGFHQPSQNLVNAFKTDAEGLPLIDNFNTPGEDVTSDEGIESDDPAFTPYAGTLDPRIDWTVGRRGIPFLDWQIHPGKRWVTDQLEYGPYTVKKYMLYTYQAELYDDSGDGWGAPLVANNFKLFRYAELLLYAAEAHVELGNLQQALDLVNKVRLRAANPDGFVMNGNNKAANYYILPYINFPDKEYARKAVRFERRIELGMEGQRFYDLLRWGVAAEEKNKYLEIEKTKREYLEEGKFVTNRDEFLPIPQSAIDQSYRNGQPTLVQNDGY